MSVSVTITRKTLKKDYFQSSSGGYVSTQNTDNPEQLQSNWEETNSENIQYIQNKPTIIEEAPADDKEYARKNLAWVVISKQNNLSGEIIGSSEVTGDLRKQGELQGIVKATSIVTGYLKDINALIGGIEGSATVTGVLVSATAAQLAGAIIGSSNVTGTLTVIIADNYYYGTDASGNLGYHPIDKSDWIGGTFEDIVPGTAKDYVLDLKATSGYTIDSAVMQVDAGTLTVAIKIGTTAVTGLSAVAVDTDIDETAATAANTVVAGDKVILAVSTTYTGAPTLIHFKVNTTKA